MSDRPIVGKVYKMRRYLSHMRFTPTHVGKDHLIFEIKEGDVHWEGARKISTFMDDYIEE